MKKPLKNNLFFAIAILLICVSCQDNKYKILEAIAEETTKTCPQKMDEYTILDSVVAKKDTLEFRYTLPAELKGTAIDNPQELMKTGLIRNLKIAPSFQIIEKLEAKIVHTYLYDDGGLFLQIIINPEDYK